MKKKFLLLMFVVGMATAQQTQVITKPLKLTTVNLGANSDSLLVRGSDQIIKFIPKSSVSNNLSQVLAKGNTTDTSIFINKELDRENYSNELGYGGMFSSYRHSQFGFNRFAYIGANSEMFLSKEYDSGLTNKASIDPLIGFTISSFSPINSTGRTLWLGNDDSINYNFNSNDSTATVKISLANGIKSGIKEFRLPNSKPAGTYTFATTDQIDNIENQINPNTYVVIDNGYTFSGGVYTLNANWQWKINGVNNTNPNPVVINIPLAPTGQSRVDLIVLNSSNTAIRVQGTASATTPSSPTIPLGTILVSFVLSSETTQSSNNPKSKNQVSQFLRNGELNYAPSEDVVYDNLATKQNTILLTTTGTSGASTLVGNTLNIPNYASGASLSGTTNYITKFATNSTVGNSIIYDDGSKIGIGTTTPFGTVEIKDSNSTISGLTLSNLTQSSTNNINTTYSAQNSVAYPIVVDTNNNVYISNGDGTITKITPSGITSTFATLTAPANSLAIDSLNNLIAGCSQDIYKITPSGTVTTYTSLINSTYYTRQLKFNSSGELYALSQKNVTPYNTDLYKIDQFGNATRLIQDIGGLTVLKPYYGLVVDTNNNCYVSSGGAYGSSSSIENQYIYKITPSNVVTLFTTIPSEKAAFNLCIDNDNNIYYLAWQARNIYKITPSGTTSLFVSSSYLVSLNGGIGTKPYAMKLNKDGYFYYVNGESSSKLTRLDMNGFGTSIGAISSYAYDLAFDSYNSIYTPSHATSGTKYTTKTTISNESKFLSNTISGLIKQDANLISNNNGLIKLPNTTNTLIDADVTNKSAITKEYFSFNKPTLQTLLNNSAGTAIVNGAITDLSVGSDYDKHNSLQVRSNPSNPNYTTSESYVALDDTYMSSVYNTDTADGAFNNTIRVRPSDGLTLRTSLGNTKRSTVTFTTPTIISTMKFPAPSVAGTYTLELKPIVYTVSTLPSSPLLGDKVIVTDALAPTYLGTLVGGGSTTCFAFYNGTIWVTN